MERKQQQILTRPLSKGTDDIFRSFLSFLLSDPSVCWNMGNEIDPAHLKQGRRVQAGVIQTEKSSPLLIQFLPVS